MGTAPCPAPRLLTPISPKLHGDSCPQAFAFDDVCTGSDPALYWIVDLIFELPASTYQVLDSDPATWANNDETGDAGIALMWGYQLDGAETDGSIQETEAPNTSVSLVRDGVTIDLVAEGVFDVFGYCESLLGRFSVSAVGPVLPIDDPILWSWTVWVMIDEGIEDPGNYDTFISLTDSTYFVREPVFDEIQKRNYEGNTQVTVTMPDGLVRIEFGANVSDEAGTAVLAGVF